MTQLSQTGYEELVRAMITRPAKITQQDVSAAFAAGLLVGLEAPDVARWLITGEVELNDRAGRRQGWQGQSGEVNRTMAKGVAENMREIIAVDPEWQTRRI